MREHRRAHFGARYARDALRLVALFFVVPALACEVGGEAPHSGLRNALLIVVDTLRFDHVGSYGSSPSYTPRIDGLALESVRFDRAYAAAPWTKPSVASILTGLYPHSSGTGAPSRALRAEAETLAERLSARDFATEAIVSHVWLGPASGLSQGFEAYDTDEVRGHNAVTTPGVTRKALAALERLAAREAPFLLFVHYFDPHYAYLDHPEIDHAPARAGSLDGSESFRDLQAMRQRIRPEELAFLKARYDEEVQATDAGIGRLLDEIDSLELSDQTLVILTADHGEEFFERGWLGHTRSLNEEVIRVPLIIRAPGAPPRVVRTPVSLVSVTPTILDLLGAEPVPGDFEADSLATLVRGESREREGFVFAEVDFDPIFDKRKRAFKKAIIGERFKLIRDDESGKLELFNLDKDAGERRNLARKRPGLAGRMAALLDEHLQEPPLEGTTPPEHQLTPGEVEQLEALGYAEPASSGTARGRP
jgi:arylsulfatase A-like enzyme